METATPEAVGLSSERLTRIDNVMQSYIDQKKLAGIMTVVARRGKIAHQACFGMADTEAGKPLASDTIFRIYSMTKPITSVAVMMLFEEGHFQLDDPVAKFIPELGGMKVFVKKTEAGLELAEQEQPITIRHLLTHTSGLPYGNPDGSPVEVRHHEGLDWSKTLREMVQGFSKLPLVFQPGSAWQYGTSHEVLGYLVEVVSGRSFDGFLKERIFEPLGMVDTGFYVPEEKLDRLPPVYGPAEGGGLRPVDTLGANSYSRPKRLLSGGGGLVSTASDYMRFSQVLLNRGELEGVRLLGRKTVELMMMNHLSPQQLASFQAGQLGHMLTGHGFGLGLRVLMDVSQVDFLGSTGECAWGGAAYTMFWLDPQEEMSCLFLTQFMPAFFYPVERQFKTLAYQAIVD